MPRGEQELFALYLDEDGMLNVRLNIPPALAANFRDERHMMGVYHALKTLRPMIDMILQGITDRIPPPPKES